MEELRLIVVGPDLDKLNLLVKNLGMIDRLVGVVASARGCLAIQ